MSCCLVLRLLLVLRSCESNSFSYTIGIELKIKLWVDGSGAFVNLRAIKRTIQGSILRGIDKILGFRVVHQQDLLNINNNAAVSYCCF